MAQTDVNIDATSGPFANPNSVPVVEGDTVTITVSGGAVTLYFSPGCLSVLSPAPHSMVTLAEDDTLDFTFTSSNAGNYMIDISNDPSQHPHFPPMSSNTLTFTTLLHKVRAAPSSIPQGNL